MNSFHILPFILQILSVQTTEYSLVIDEKSSIDKPIFRFPHSYELVTNFQSNFNLTNDQKDLILTKLIDRDFWCSQNICSCESCSIILQLFSNEDPLAKFSTINITINDKNDHSCQFLDVQNQIALSESIQIGHRFPIARAIDYDSGLNGKLSFELRQIDNYFQLDIVKLSNNEYAIYGIVQRPLDRELFEQYSLMIHAYDHGAPQKKSNQTQITIEILDENDNAPKFNQTEYSIQSLLENTPIDIPLLQVFASDADKGSNGLIHYSIVNGINSSSFPFVIDSSTGVITARTTLDYETMRSYRFLIRAADSGVPKSLFTDTWLSISIQDINDCPVEIFFVPHRRFEYKNQTLFIEENIEANNMTLGYLRLSDRDTITAKLSVSFSSMDPFQRQEYDLIESNQPNTYLLMVKRGVFDREIQSIIHLRFVATDGLLNSIYDLKIHLIDLNDNPSEFLSNPVQFFVEEVANHQMKEQSNDNYRLTIGYLKAVDRDEGENAVNVYELESNPWVKIDPTDGRVYLVQPMDREYLSKIELKGKAINLEQPKWETQVKIEINVLDVNDHVPQCSTKFTRLSISENHPIEKSLFQVNATDPDDGLNGTIRYLLRSNSTWPFEIDERTGEIFSKSAFDYESELKSFSLTIDLEDQGNMFKLRNNNACQIELIIKDENDNKPELVDKDQQRIFFDLKTPIENATILLKIIDKDSGINGKVKYSLQAIESTTPLNSNQTIIQLDQNGLLQIVDRFHEVSLLKLKILLEDYGYPSQENLISILIAFGDHSNSKYSSFDKVLQHFEQQRFQTNPFAFLFGLTILILTLVCFTSMILVCVLIKKHHRRHQTSMIARKQLLCSSSQQLANSDSTVASTATTLSLDHQQRLRPSYWNPQSSIDQQSILPRSSPESYTYTILHVPIQHESHIHYDEKEKCDEISCDHGYHGSYQTGSPSSASTEHVSYQLSIPQNALINQLPAFVTKCQSLQKGFIVEMNVDGSDEEAREFN